MKLSDLLSAAGEDTVGDFGNTDISGVCELTPGQAGKLAWCGSPRYIEAAQQSLASVILTNAELAEQLPNAIAVNNPQAAFSKVAAVYQPDDRPAEGVHETAFVDATAELAEGVRIGAQASIGARARIASNVSIGEGTVVGADAVIGNGSRLAARVTVEPRCRIGDRALILPGAVIGSRGYGNYHDGSGWHEIPQLGSVVIGNDVEIGANTTIDRGALGDTVIGDNVRIDNLCQIAHNVQIGPQTALAAQVGIAGSTVIGAGCMIGGQAGVSGHLQIADRVILNGGAVVYQSISESGQYGSGTPLLSVGAFRRLIVLLRGLEPRLKKLEKALRR